MYAHPATEDRMTSAPHNLANHPLSPAQERWLRECASAPDTARQILRLRLRKEFAAGLRTRTDRLAPVHLGRDHERRWDSGE